MQEQKKEYPKWFVELLQDVLDMRDAQRDYFTQPSEYRLKRAKAREKRVDMLLDVYLQNGLVKHKVELPANQRGLFPGV